MGDYKSFLFTWCAKSKRPTPEITIREAGSIQQKRFICEITMSDLDYVAVGNSTSKKDAQLNAARDFVQFLIRTKIVSDAEVKANLKNEANELLSSASKSSKPVPLGLNHPSTGSVFKAGFGPQSLGVAYQPVNNSRTPFDFSALDKKTVDEQELVDVNASIHGNWTVAEARSRLNQFMQTNKIKGDFKYSFIGPDNAKTFIAELTIFVPQLGRKLTGRESGSSKMAASKSCALSLIRQLYHLGVVERCSTVTGTAPKRQEQMPPYQVAVDPQLLDQIKLCLESADVDWMSGLNSSDEIKVLLPGRHGEHPEDDNKTRRVVTWSPPQTNWDPWKGSNIDDANPNLASASMEYISEELQKDLAVGNAEKDRILRERKQLPIFSCKKQVLDLVSNNSVIIIKGQTGCGKTTQVCQYILDSWIESGQGAECNIVITQPRRISAISVAERVARERCEDLGVSCGYSVRFDSVFPRPYGGLLFCTVGVLLRKLELGLRGISHVIVDEIHERDVNTDFLLVVLRDTLHVYPDLRVILMSATVDTQLFSAYFNNCPVIEVPGRCFDVHTYFLEDVVQMLNFTPPPPKKRSKAREPDESEDEELSAEYQQSTKDSLALLDDKEIPFELIHEILLWCKARGDGAVLVFLPGWNTIFSLMKRLLYSHEFRKPCYVILPLHSQLPREEQRLVFEEPPPGVMKVILATNIAESSITINDVVYVVDCCKVKVKMFTSHNNMIHYATVWASRSNMEQRAGRAGRTANGYCFRLCTKSRYNKLEEHIVAEMLRSSLEELALSIKLLGLGSVAHFLSKALEPPPIDSVIEAQILLKELTCLDENYDLTPLGRLIAKLPLEPRLAKMMITGCLLELGDAVASIASNISLASEVFDVEVSMTGKQRWFGGSRCSDQIAMLNALQRFESLECRGVEAQQDFTCNNALSFPSLVITGEAKQQIKEILTSSYFPEECMMPLKFTFNGEDENLDLMAALLTIGSYPNVCYHKERRKVLTTESKPALIIKTSINFTKFQTNFPSPFFVYSEKLRTKTVYCKTLTMVSPVHLLLFGCNQVDVIKNIVRLDGWIHLDMDAQAAALILGLRPLLREIVTRVASSPDYIFSMTPEDKNIMHLIKQLCCMNTGRYNMDPYVMVKEGRTGRRYGGPTDSMNPGYSLSKPVPVQPLPPSSTSAYRSYEKAGVGSRVVGSVSEQDDDDDDSSSSFPNHPDIQVLHQVNVPKKKPVKLDPNTSSMLLARHRQEAAAARQAPPPKPSFDYDDDIQQGVQSMGLGQRNTQQRTSNNRSYEYSDNPYQSQDYAANPYQSQRYGGNSYPAPRGRRGGGRNRTSNMYGSAMQSSANYYKQRYSQPNYDDAPGGYAPRGGMRSQRGGYTNY